jgi:hypothetical protein
LNRLKRWLGHEICHAESLVRATYCSNWSVEFFAGQLRAFEPTVNL